MREPDCADPSLVEMWAWERGRGGRLDDLRANGEGPVARHDNWTPYARPSERDAVALRCPGLPS